MSLEFLPIVKPRFQKAKICVWSDLSVHHLDLLENCQTADEKKSCLKIIFGLPDVENDSKQQITLDLYYYTLLFCKEHRFNKEQMSGFFSIVKKTHELAIETPFGNIEETFTYFKDLIHCHSVHRPPFSLAIFSPEEVRLLITYVLDTYFRHYKMYKFCFTPQVYLDLNITYDGTPNTSPPQPLSKGATLRGNTNLASSRPSTQSKPVVAPSGADIKEEKPVTAENAPKEVVIEESEAAKLLREMVYTHLSGEMKKLKLTIDSQIKTTEENLTQRLSKLETSPGVAAAGNKEQAKKSGRNSSKGKR